MKFISLEEAIGYEVGASWWAWLIWFGWGQELVAQYYAWKTKRKFKRYQWWAKIAKEVEHGLN